LECDESYDYSLNHIATDICDYNVEITVASSTTDDKCNNVTSYSWTATDSCGHVITDDWKITVQDTTKPTLSQYPEDRHIPCVSLNGFSYGTDVSTYTEIWPGIITATDNCHYQASVKFTLDRVNGECDHDYDLVMTWSAVDDCGNEESHSMTAYINDKTPPVWQNIPDDVTISVYSGYDDLVTAKNAISATDDCEPYVKITATETELRRQYNRDCPNEWIIVRTFTATDDCGNAIYHTASISSIDTLAPTLPSIDDFTIECDEYDESYEDCEVVPTSFGDESLEVILSSQTRHFGKEECPVLFEIYKTWTVVDCAGMSATTTQTVTVVDSTAPVFSNEVLDSIEVECSCDNFPEAVTLKAYDNCDEVSVSFNEESTEGTCAQSYAIERVWFAEDSCGNAVEQYQQILVMDNEEPFFCDEGDYTQTYSCDAVPDDLEPVAGDECDENVEVEVITDGDIQESICAGSYTLEYSYLATDDCGNEKETSRSYTVLDSSPPTLDEDSRYCLFVSYGSAWGSWAGYNLDFLFRSTDNCFENSYLDLEEDLKCNVTDAPSYVSSPKSTSVGNGFNEDCYVIKKGGKYFLLVKIDREEDPPSQILGRTYHVYGSIIDDCSNSAYVRRDIFIPLDNSIYRHVQPCGTGNPAYYETPPTEL